MRAFISWLESLNEGDTRVRAVLRRSLAFDPGEYPPAFPYVEPFVNDNDNYWLRKMHYLTAGLWASHWSPGRTGVPVTVGKACAAYQSTSGSTSTERRFIALLDADGDQLPHRLRQMIALLKEQAIDFDGLLKGILQWNGDRKRTQNAWARDYYRNMETEKDQGKLAQTKEKSK